MKRSNATRDRSCPHSVLIGTVLVFGSPLPCLWVGGVPWPSALSFNFSRLSSSLPAHSVWPWRDGAHQYLGELWGSQTSNELTHNFEACREQMVDGMPPQRHLIIRATLGGIASILQISKLRFKELCDLSRF